MIATYHPDERERQGWSIGLTGGHPNGQLERRGSALTKEGKLDGERMGAILHVLQRLTGKGGSSLLFRPRGQRSRKEDPDQGQGALVFRGQVQAGAE